MGRPLPGYRIRLVDADGQDARGRRDRHRARPAPAGLMRGYQQEDGSIAGLDRRGLSHRRRRHARRRRLHHLCRPRRRRLQSLRLPHQPVRTRKRADRAPGGRRGRGGPRARPDAARGRRRPMSPWSPAPTADRATALSIFRHIRDRLAPFKRVRRLEFADLPKTISGKIRRVELRREEQVARRRRHPRSRRIPRGGFPRAEAGRRAGMKVLRRNEKVGCATARFLGRSVRTNRQRGCARCQTLTARFCTPYDAPE